MTEALENLKSDHEYILKAIDGLENLSSQISGGGEVPVDEIEKAVEFIREFADRCHHSKEEKLLFPALEKHGMPKNGPTAIMLLEHDEGRGFVKDLVESLEDYKKGLDSRERIAGSIDGYTSLLKAHIDKENTMLYPMGEKILPDDVKQNLMVDFEKAEQDFGEERHHEFAHFAEELNKKYVK